ncbi:MAG: hypothetical protein OXT67_07995 [Zetaproteobacteria bacterium]|nr:hypothetical protein [Zetaproteobacteria bacterium]
MDIDRDIYRRRPVERIYKDFHTGELKKVVRRTALRAHDMLPTDIVELSTQKNVDWQEGERHEVKHISYKSPNVIQIRDEDSGEATFFDAHDLKLVEKRAFRGGKRINSLAANAYLRWP